LARNRPSDNRAHGEERWAARFQRHDPVSHRSPKTRRPLRNARVPWHDWFRVADPPSRGGLTLSQEGCSGPLYDICPLHEHNRGGCRNHFSGLGVIWPSVSLSATKDVSGVIYPDPSVSSDTRSRRMSRARPRGASACLCASRCPNECPSPSLS
jgi:hypothetical protein